MKSTKPTKQGALPALTPQAAPRLLAPESTQTPKGKRTRLGITTDIPGRLPEKWTFEGRIDEEPDEALARLRTAPAYNAGEVIYAYNGTSNDTLRGLINELDRQTRAVHGEDLSQMESMLTAQAHTLDAVFTRLAKRAHANFDGAFEVGERFLRLALKAQTQCRATIETLGQLKNPTPVAFVRQANFAAGHQQVNNGAQGQTPSRAGDFEIPPSKLLEAIDGERLDTGTASATGRTNQDLAAVGKFDGAKISKGKGRGRKECI